MIKLFGSWTRYKMLYMICNIKWFWDFIQFRYFFKESDNMKNSSSFDYMYHNYTMTSSSLRKALTDKALSSLFRLWWAKVNQLNRLCRKLLSFCAGSSGKQFSPRAVKLTAETFVLCRIAICAFFQVLQVD